MRNYSTQILSSKSIFLTLLGLLLTTFSYSQTDPVVYFSQDEIIQTEINFFTAYQKNRLSKIKSEHKKQYVLFRSIQKKYFRNYATYQSLQNTVKQGRYDCVSATALYALVLKKMGCHFTIHQTKFHVFLMIHLPKKAKILIETTDPIHGFVSNNKAIEKRILEYSKNEETLSNELVPIHNNKEQITLKELAGLLYYNIAVAKFNEHSFEEAIEKSIESLKLYDAPKTKELLMLSIAYLPKEIQKGYFDKYYNHYQDLLTKSD